MATSHHHAVPSGVSAIACAMYGADHPLAASYSSSATSTTVIDTDDIPSLSSFATSSSDDDLNDATNNHHAPTLATVRPKSTLDWLYRLVVALIIQISVIASVVISLKDRITAVEGAQAPAFVRSQETEVLRQQVNELCKRAASQQDRIGSLEVSQRAEMIAYKKEIQELATKMDDIKADGDRKSCNSDDALEKLRQSLKDFQMTMDFQRARVTGIKADVALKIHLLQKEMVGVQTELAAVKMVAVPANVLSAGEVARDARKTGVLGNVDQNVEITQEMRKSCALPPIIDRSSACSTVPEASTSSGTQSIALNDGKDKETRIRRPLTVAHKNQPGAGKVPARSTIPTTKIPTGRAILTKGNDKQENKACKSSTKMTVQHTKLSKPGAGRTPDVMKKSSTANAKKAQSGTGTSSGISALPKPRGSMLPAPRKSLLPSLTLHTVVDGSSSKEVKKASCLPGGSRAAQMTQPKTSKNVAIAASRPLSESSSSRNIESVGSIPSIPASSSLAALDAALHAMQFDHDDLLMRVPALSSLYDDPYFSGLATVRAKGKVQNKNIHVGAKEGNVDMKLSRSPLRSSLSRTQAENIVTLPASLSLAALDAAVQLQGERGVLALMPAPDYVDLSFSAPAPVLLGVKPPYERESICVSPMRMAAARPSRRL